MTKTIRTLICLAFCVIIVLFITSGCFSSRKPYLITKSKNSTCNMAHLGKNKYFYSASYQRKLKKSEFKIGGKFTTYKR